MRKVIAIFLFELVLSGCEPKEWTMKAPEYVEEKHWDKHKGWVVDDRSVRLEFKWD